jgi:polyhydroxyalkanoate synthase
MENPEGFPAGIGYPVGQTLDPLGMLKAAGDLVNPAAAARQLPWLASELLNIALGRSSIQADKQDPRFADVTWRANPFFHLLAQAYGLFEEWIDRMADEADGSWDRQSRTHYLANILTATVAPTNFLLTNPVALKRVLETGGQSVVRGGQNMLRDLARGGMPRMVDTEPFPVGEKLACTPGAVVYRDEIFELLQYQPTTPKVHRRPLLMVPPELNRHYVLDLAPERSLVEFAVGHGIQTFMIVWRNPRAELGHGRWGMDDYLAAHLRAAEIVQNITRSETINWLGLCAGGLTSALMLGYMAAKGNTSVNSATYLVTLLNNSCPNIVGMMDTEASRAMLRRAAAAGQIFPGRMVRSTFAWLRPNDLVYNYLVRGWLLGEDAPAFDVLAWNDDATAMTARFSVESTEMLVDGTMGAAGGMTVLGTPIDLAKVDRDSFFVAGYTDHITPWRACYDSSRMLGGDKEMVIVKSGHIQSFVNPAKTGRYDYWWGPPTSPDPEQWRATATEQTGSWWPRWVEWLIARSGDEKEPRGGLGNRKHPPLGPAPGTYVHE